MNENGWENKHGSGTGSFFILLYSLIVLLADLQIEISMIFLSLFFLKTTSLPLRGFHPSCFPWAPQERFSPIDIFFLHHWANPRGFQPNSGTQVPHGGFHLSLLIFFLLNHLLRQELRLSPLPSLFYWYHQWTLSLTMVFCKLSICAH